MTSTEILDTHGTARIPGDSVISRSMRIFKTVAEVNRAWHDAGIPGTADVTAAGENRGAVIRVELEKDDEASWKQKLSHYDGATASQKLEAALRQLKSRLETGEVATTEGQPSGRAR